jgi:NDP-sugar pyrophosphorylase family protein
MPGSSGALPPTLLLTAGLGTRLRPLTDVRAKAAVPVNGEPLVHRIIRWLARAGVEDLVLNLHHRPATITGVVGDGSDCGVRVRYSWEQPVLGSAGGPRHALPLLLDRIDRPFLIVNGDTLTDVDVRALVSAHCSTDALITMALIPNPRPDKYGGVRVAADGVVEGFARAGTGGVSYHFIGVQVASGSAFAELSDGVPAESVNTWYPRLIATRRGSVRAFVCNASFRDIGTPDDYLRTSIAIAAEEGERLASGQRSSVHPSARLSRTAVWDDVVVGPEASLTECILGDGVSIPAGASYARCAIVRTTRAPKPDERIEGELLIRALE